MQEEDDRNKLYCKSLILPGIKGNCGFSELLKFIYQNQDIKKSDCEIHTHNYENNVAILKISFLRIVTKMSEL